MKVLPLLLILAIIAFQFCWFGYYRHFDRVFARKHYMLLVVLTLSYNIQLLLGWILFIKSPLVHEFWSNYALYVKHRQMRFFGMEHVTVMTICIGTINYYTFQCYRKIGNKQVYHYLWKRYCWLFTLILLSIPWSFSPLTSRPNFR